MAVSHEITHEIMYHLAVGSDAGSRCFDRIRSLNLSTAYLWVFLVVYDDLDMYRICAVTETVREYL